VLGLTSDEVADLVLVAVFCLLHEAQGWVVVMSSRLDSSTSTLFIGKPPPDRQTANIANMRRHLLENVLRSQVCSTP
jgi:hypothetical protein